MTSMFGHEIRSDLIFLYLAETCAVFLAVFVLTAQGAGGGVAVDPARAGLVAAVVALCCGLVSAASGLYQPEVLSRAKRLAAGTTIAALLLLLLAWISVELIAPPRGDISRPALLTAAFLGCLLGVAVARIGILAATRTGLLTRRLLILRDGLGPVIAEHGPNADGQGGILHARASLSPTESEVFRPGWLRSNHIWAVVVPDPATVTDSIRRHCRGSGVRILSEDDVRECSLNRVACDRLAPDWLATARGAREGRVEAVLRRGLDVTVALALLVVTLPVWVIAALVIRFDSPGPIFYWQERVGLQGRRFTLCKFRSMVTDAEAGGAARWAVPGDPRVTRVGRFIRLTRIDELPQILNVLRGDMSVVGPRPERPAFVEELGRVIPHYHDRAQVKPGITGWAQVNYPYGASVEDARMKLAYDLYYVRRRSLFLDLLILIATVRVVLFQEGAR